MEIQSLENIIFMKYGEHASENVESIIERKSKEHDGEEKVFWWGYGGKVCHPLKQVQPFIKECQRMGQKVYLVLSPTPSPNIGDSGTRAIEFSKDKENWERIAESINVYGSDYALVCNNLRKVDFTLDLSKYEVAVGAKKGKVLSDYISGRNDKGCAYLIREPKDYKPQFVQIDYIAEIIDPYAVFVRYKKNIDRVVDFLKKAGTYYLATAEGDQPRVRPFGTAHVFEDRLYIQTGKVKEVSKQILTNPKVEICAFMKGEWMRIAGELVEDDRLEARQSMLDAYPSLQKMYAADDGNTQVFYFKNATVTVSAFTHEPEVFQIG